MNNPDLPILDSFHALTEAQRAEISAWICEKRPADATAIRRCRNQWNLTLAPEQMKDFRARAKAWWNRTKNLEYLRSGAATAQVFQKAVTDNPARFFDTLFQATGQVSFDRVLERKDPESIKLAHEHLRLILTRCKDDRDEKRYGLQREKWEFEASDACLKQLPELKVISDAPELTFKEKLRQIRLKLFGSAP